MTAAQKFMFERTFDNQPSVEPVMEDTGVVEPDVVELQETVDVVEEEVQPGFSEQQMEAAKAEAFETGRQEGIKEASTAVEQETLNAIRAIGQHITELFGAQEQANSTMMKDGIDVATTIVRKLFPSLDEAGRFDEIDRLIEQTLLRLIDEPRVVVRINPSLVDTLKARLDGLKAGSGYEGRIILKEDASLNLGDCRLEWGEGSAERNATMLWQSIDDIIENNVGIVKRIIPEDFIVDVTLKEPNSDSIDDISDELSENESPQDPASTQDHSPPNEALTESPEESREEIAQAEVEPEPESEPARKQNPQDTADALGNSEQDMIAATETDIVQPEQTSGQSEQAPVPEDFSGDGNGGNEDQTDLKLTSPDKTMPNENISDEANSDEIDR